MRMNTTNYNSFTIETVKDKNLIITMLKFEDTVIHGDVGKSIFNDDSYEHFTTLEAMLCIHRYVLNYFGFSNKEEDVTNYRKIFSNYYKSPTDYDNDVISSVTYMRENKCIYYKNPDYNIGDKFADINIYNICGKQINIYDKINKESNYTLVGAFSNS